MATVDTLVANIKAGITAQSGSVIYPTAVVGDDFALASGSTAVQISAIPSVVQTRADGNQAYTVVTCSLRVHHSLAWPSESLESYQLGLAEQLATYLVTPATWRGFAAVYDLASDEIEGPSALELVGHVASFRVVVQVALAP
jgi:hypothetical protein